MAVKPTVPASLKCPFDIYTPRFKRGMEFEDKVISSLLELGISPERIKRNVEIAPERDADIIIDDRIGIEAKQKQGKLGGYWDVSGNRLIYYAWRYSLQKPIPIEDCTYLIDLYREKGLDTFVLVTDAPVSPHSPYHFCIDGGDVYVCKDFDLKNLLLKLVSIP